MSEPDWDAEHPLLLVLKHFATKGLLIVGVWGVKHLVWKQRRDKHDDEKPFRTHHNPGSEFRPANPRWLVEAAASDGELAEIPTFPFRQRMKELHGAEEPQVEAGTPALGDLFTLDPSWHYLNHGSYGASLRLASEAQQWWREHLEQQPVQFHEAVALPALKAARDDVAGFVGAKPADVVPVTNATEAVNIVINSMKLSRKDCLLMTNLTYPAVRNALARAAARSGASLLEVLLPLSVLQQGDAGVIDAFRQGLSAVKGRVKLAVLDHIGSFPPVRFPVAELCRLCRGAGAKVLIDGAHAVGAISLDVPSLGAHYYTSNLHKWLCTPKGSAFLWVTPSEQPRTLPLITSHGYGLGFQGEFLWQGTSDTTAWLAAPAALHVMRGMGVDRWQQHNHQLLQEAVAFLLRSFQTDLTVGDGAPDACMAAVELPHNLPLSASVQDALSLHESLRSRFKIEVPVVCWEGRLWARISAQYYNTMADYQALANAVRQLCSEGKITEDDNQGATHSFRQMLANGYSASNGTKSSTFASNNA